MTFTKIRRRWHDFCLRGEYDKMHLIVGQAWPVPSNRIDLRYGEPECIQP